MNFYLCPHCAHQFNADDPVTAQCPNCSQIVLRSIIPEDTTPIGTTEDGVQMHYGEGYAFTLQDQSLIPEIPEGMTYEICDAVPFDDAVENSGDRSNEI